MPDPKQQYIDAHIDDEDLVARIKDLDQRTRELQRQWHAGKLRVTPKKKRRKVKDLTRAEATARSSATRLHMPASVDAGPADHELPGADAEPNSTTD